MTNLTEDRANGSESLPLNWFRPGIIYKQLRHHFLAAEAEIRIATGFFTISGWEPIRKFTTDKRIYLLVGIDEPGEGQARAALVQSMMEDLATGLERNRRKAVEDLVERMNAQQFRILDARATKHHGKLYLVDRLVAIHASANLTRRGLMQQVENGGVVTDPKQVAILVEEFDGYFAVAHDITAELLDALNRWLELAKPWAIYLKTMLALEDLQPLKQIYKKRLLNYQIDMTARTLHQLRERGGSLLVASTGLGKTVVAIYVALYLRYEDEIHNVMVIAPKAVHRMWERELLAAGIAGKCFTRQALNLKKSASGAALADFEEFIQSLPDKRWLLVIDESHNFRNRHVDKKVGREYQQVESLIFKRLQRLIQTGRVKVLELTASPYGKNIENLNNQLFLLPHTAPNLSSEEISESPDRAWKVDSVEEFINLPVVSQLTTPYVAKHYGQKDGEHIYIQQGQEKLYFPKLRLHSIHFPLLFENELSRVFVENYFDLDSRIPKIRKLIARTARVAWTSSPLALRGVLERVIDTPGGPNEYDFFTADFAYLPLARRRILSPLVEQLKSQTYADDPKLGTLLNLLSDIKARQEKAIVFCERRATVIYLMKGLKELMPSLRVVGTIEEIRPNDYEMKETREIEKLIQQFAPIANNFEGKNQEDYDVFVSTDAHGVGVNMQDASVVFNYDIDIYRQQY